MTSAHCTTTMLTKKAVWHVNSTIFLCSYVWGETERNLNEHFQYKRNPEKPKKRRKHNAHVPTAVHSCPLGHWVSDRPTQAWCLLAYWAGNHSQPGWQSRKRSLPMPGSYLRDTALDFQDLSLQQSRHLNVQVPPWIRTTYQFVRKQCWSASRSPACPWRGSWAGVSWCRSLLLHRPVR